ncbi:MAG: PolC-type DNA polymerase III [Clostridiales bacterium]|nr:PolC-type DNA polymerase III [Clostridiales bacterium]
MNQIIEQTISWDKIGVHDRSEYKYALGNARISKDRQVLTVSMDLNFIIPHSDICTLKQKIKGKASGVGDVEFAFNYKNLVLTEQEAVRGYLPYAAEEAAGSFPAAARALITDEFLMADGALTLYTSEGAAAEELGRSATSLFEGMFMKTLGLDKKISFESRGGELAEKAPKPSKKKADGRGAGAKGKNSGIIKRVTGDAVALRHVSPDSGSVVVEGELFKMSQMTIKSGNKLVTLLVTDKTTSICGKAFLTDEKWDELRSYLKEGDFVRLQGEAEWDKFENATVLSVKGVEKGHKHVREDHSENPRVELHAHTKMSAMDGLNDVEEMVKLAASWNHKAIAITDHGVVQAFPDAAKAVKGGKLGIKIIYGVEGYFFDDGKYTKPDGGIDYKKPATYHIIILARTREGLKNLYKLVSMSHLEYFYKKPRIPKSVLSAHREGLLVGSACQAGEVYRAVLEKKGEGEAEKLAGFYDYLEVQPLINNQFLIDNKTVSGVEELKEINRRIVELGERLGKPVVATCDAHYQDPEDALYRKILMAGQGYKDLEGDEGLYVRTTEEMLEEFSYLGKDKANDVVVVAPNAIAALVEDISPVPAEKCPPKIKDADETLRERCMERAWSLYGKPLPEAIGQRLERELDSIINNGYAVMYVSAEMLVQKSLADGYLVGSRGSVGSSLAATMAGITEVNPLPAHYVCPSCKHFEWGDPAKYECGVDMDEKSCPECGKRMNQDGFMIPFETFLGFEGDKEPDIDLNFAGEYQVCAHKYVEEIFGKNNVFRAGTIGTIASRTAYGFVMKYFEERGIPLNKWEADRLAMCCTGVRRTTGQHPGGIIIVPQGREIYEFCPVQHPANDTGTDIVTTHFDYHAIDKNLFKLDILGHDAPSMIRHLQDMTGVDPLTLPLKDAKVNSIFNGIEALGIKAADYKYTHGSYGIPEFGTRFVRQMLDDTKPEKFADLVKISGCSHGTNVWRNNALDYIKSGTATMDDIISTRDDIMRFLILKGLPNNDAFRIMESVRRGEGVKEKEADLMRQNGVPEWYIESCRKIEYMFPRAHAVAYVMMAYRIAHFKVYHPVEFYAAYFTTKASNFDADTILKGPAAILDRISAVEVKGKSATQKEEDEATVFEAAYEMYSRGHEFLPARIESSFASKFTVMDGKVLMPLLVLSGLGETAAKAIAEEHEKRPFNTIDDLRERAKVNKTAIEALRKHGALDGLPESDQLSFFQ